MIYSDSAELKTLALHKVGNKSTEDGIRFSVEPIKIEEVINELLLKYFFMPFKSEEYYNFFHESDIELNEAFAFASRIFDDPSQLFEQSKNFAKHLYEHSTHPKIKVGEFYVTYFKDCVVDGETTDAIGLFKSESKETYLKVYTQGENFEINSDDGININKLDKGALIFNTERENGFLVAVVDTLSKGAEARYWYDQFLHVKQREDIYFQTENTLNMCKKFVTEQLPEKFDVDRADQAEMLNNSVAFFKEKEQFDLEEFSKEIIQQPEAIESFKEFKNNFESSNNVSIEDKFDISNSAVKKQSRAFKSVIKLDKNFHLYVHGNTDNIERGWDEEKAMNYYKVFFKEEL